MLFLFLVQVDPLVSLMMVEKVPDSTYEMVGGLDKQIKEIKEVTVSSVYVMVQNVSSLFLTVKPSISYHIGLLIYSTQHVT